MDSPVIEYRMTSCRLDMFGLHLRTSPFSSASAAIIFSVASLVIRLNLIGRSGFTGFLPSFFFVPSRRPSTFFLETKALERESHWKRKKTLRNRKIDTVRRKRMSCARFWATQKKSNKFSVEGRQKNCRCRSLLTLPLLACGHKIIRSTHTHTHTHTHKV